MRYGECPDNEVHEREEAHLSHQAQQKPVETNYIMSTSMEPSTPVPEVGEEKSYQEIYFEKVHEVMDRCGAKGYTVVRGINRDRDEDEDEEDTEEEGQKQRAPKERDPIPEHKFADFRIVLVTDKREADIKKADDFVTCGQSDDCCQMYNTHTGNTVIMGIAGRVNSAMRRKSIPARFDALFALTTCLHDTSCWIEDNECWGEGGECERALKTLARAWKKLLALSDADLGMLKSCGLFAFADACGDV
jgi:hypothetical protein